MRQPVTLMILALAAVGISSATVVYSPGSLAATEGNTNNSIPFDISGFATSMRYQQVYPASDFAGGPVLITQIAFRPDASVGFAFSSTLPDIQINMSTTSASDLLNTTFANNVGANDTIVYARGALSLSSAFTGPAGGPKDFDIIIALTTPFFYDPSLGNLLLDVRNFGGGSTTSFDADTSSTDGVGRLFSSPSGSVSDPSGTNSTLGLVTQFTTTDAIPEPASLLLSAAGLLALGCFRIARRS